MHEHLQKPEDDHLHKNQQPSSTPEQNLTLPGQMPSGIGTRAMRQANVLQMQRTLGNAAVQRMMASDVQREVTIDEMTTSVDTAGGGTGGGAAAGTQIGDGSASISAESGVVKINAGRVEVNSPMTEHTGVDKSSTVITDSVVATSYTPGAGNVW